MTNYGPDCDEEVTVTGSGSESDDWADTYETWADSSQLLRVLPLVLGAARPSIDHIIFADSFYDAKVVLRDAATLLRDHNVFTLGFHGLHSVYTREIDSERCAAVWGVLPTCVTQVQLGLESVQQTSMQALVDGAVEALQHSVTLVLLVDEELEPWTLQAIPQGFGAEAGGAHCGAEGGEGWLTVEVEGEAFPPMSDEEEF